MFQSISAANRTSGWLMSMILSSAGSSRSFWRSSRGLLIAFPNVDDTLRESRITQKQNPKTQESEVQLPAFLQNRILHQDQFRLFPSPICILHGRPQNEPQEDKAFQTQKAGFAMAGNEPL